MKNFHPSVRWYKNVNPEGKGAHGRNFLPDPMLCADSPGLSPDGLPDSFPDRETFMKQGLWMKIQRVAIRDSIRIFIVH